MKCARFVGSEVIKKKAVRASSESTNLYDTSNTSVRHRVLVEPIFPTEAVADHETISNGDAAKNINIPLEPVQMKHLYNVSSQNSNDKECHKQYQRRAMSSKIEVCP